MSVLGDRVELDGRTWWVGPVPEAEWDDIDVDFALTRSPEGLIYFARYIAGMHYFELYGETLFEIEWPDGVVRPAGLWPHGPFLQMAEMFVCEDQKTLLMASRGSLKTSLLQADILQVLIRDRNARMLCHMDTADNARKMVETIKDQFDQQPIILHLWGRLKSDKVWAKKGIRVKGSTRLNQRDASLEPSGTDKSVVGGHYSHIRIDDPISWKTKDSLDQLEKAKAALRSMAPLADGGAPQRVTLTPYAENDVAHDIIRRQGDQYRTLELPCGMEAVSATRLEGQSVFPQLPEKVLYDKLAEMGVEEFQAQYALKLQNPADQIFYREDFKTGRWEDRFSRANFYVLTDHALRDQETSCMSVLLGVIIDWDDTVYLADADVGYWNASDFIEHIFQFLGKWQPRTRICGVLMEDVTLGTVYHGWAKQEARRRGVDCRFLATRVARDEGAKRLRIRGLVSRFQSGKFVVLNTVPETWESPKGTELFFNPIGEEAKDGGRVPAGELVDQFIRFRNGAHGRTGAKMDIPDALSLVDVTDRKGVRYCQRSARPHYLGDAQDHSSNPFDPRRDTRGRNPIDFSKRIGQRNITRWKQRIG